MQNKCKTDLKQKEILIGDLACEMPFEIPRGIWVPEMIWLAFCSPKSHGMSRENVKSELILFGDLACEMPFEIPRGIWVPEMIWLAFCSPKSHGMSRENVKLELILIGLLFIQTPSNLQGICQILSNFNGAFGLDSTNRNLEFGTKSLIFNGHAMGILPGRSTRSQISAALSNSFLRSYQSPESPERWKINK